MTDKRIAIKEGVSELQAVKTAIHEIAHAKLHDVDLNAPPEQQNRVDRHTREVQAESVAYTVCQHFGLDTSDYSFGYVAGWSSGKEMTELKASLETIQATAKELINEIEGHFTELQQKRQAEQEQGDTFSIYQLKRGDETRDLRFEPYDRLQAAEHVIDRANYELIYTAPLTPDISLEDIYTRFNIDHPADFKGHSLSVSDIVVLHRDGRDAAHYVDSIGYREVPEFFKEQGRQLMGQPPYGYMKDPDNPKRWIVDDEAAQVVKHIYGMTLDGMGTEQIAAQLEREEILTLRAYWLKKGVKRPGKGKQQPPTKWNSSTITKILSLQEYCGDILNFKTYSKSYKNKKRIDNDRENWVVFQNVHEAIIERAVYEQVQQKRGKIRKRRTNNGEHNMFSGLLVCADCGSNLHFHFNQGNPEIKYFNCSNYKGNRGTCTSTHYVRVDFLEEVVLGEIRRLTKFASLYEDEFVKAVIGHSQQAEQTDRKLKEKELKTLLARDEELDGLFERIYEDNVSGKLSDDRFAKMSRRYEDEQKELAEKIKKLRFEIEKQSGRSMTTDMFIGLVRKYTRARKLTPRMLNELIEKIEVFNAEKIDGVWEQRLRIHYNCVGTIEIPTVLPLPIPEVSVNTRKGVVVNYAPCELAV